jgi:hypothetical protein
LLHSLNLTLMDARMAANNNPLRFCTNNWLLPDVSLVDVTADLWR